MLLKEDQNKRTCKLECHYWLLTIRTDTFISLLPEEQFQLIQHFLIREIMDYP